MGQGNPVGGAITLAITVPLILAGAILWLVGAIKDWRAHRNEPTLNEILERTEKAFKFVLETMPHLIHETIINEADSIQPTNPDSATLLRVFAEIIVRASPNEVMESWRESLQQLRQRIPASTAFWPRFGGAMFALGLGTVLGILAGNPDSFGLFASNFFQLIHWFVRWLTSIL